MREAPITSRGSAVSRIYNRCIEDHGDKPRDSQREHLQAPWPAKGTHMAEKITPRATDYSQWYLDIVKQAGLAENSDVRGCMVIKPHRLRHLGEDAARPRPAVQGHRPRQRLLPAVHPQELPRQGRADGRGVRQGVRRRHALPAQGRERARGCIVDPDAKLEEELIIRPTSETIIWNTYKNWIQSYRDLPLLINQWCNVVRWEMRTRLFLRTAEFLWQEGHTAHATQKEAEDETRQMVDVYRQFAEEWMAMPVLVGPKSDGQKFPGAVYTLCIEAMMQDGKALQAGTSHFLGQNFAKAFDVHVPERGGQAASTPGRRAGASRTRLIGGLIMTHSDDNGLVVPPRLAPMHVVIVPAGQERRGARPEHRRGGEAGGRAARPAARRVLRLRADHA